jgi:DNA-binding transcriptional MerR regulator
MNNTIGRYTIKETAKLSGLPESTLRYYESIGLIHPIARDTSSKHRVYRESDVNLVIAMACLNAIGMSIEDMRSYLKNQKIGQKAANEQIELLEAQKNHLIEQVRSLELRQRYVNSKIEYWKAVKSGDARKIEAAGKITYTIAQELKLPKKLTEVRADDSATS